MVNDHIKSQAPGQAMANCEASELDDSRRNYFDEVYDTVVIPVVLPVTQPQLWYRPGWQPCKRLHITASRIARREVYSENLRKWHWRVALASSSSSVMSTGWIAGTATAPGAMSSTS